MNRLHCTLLIFIACLIVGGCKRATNSGPRDPVPVRREKDMLMVRSEEGLRFDLLPYDRKERIFVEDLYVVEEEIKDFDSTQRQKRLKAIRDSQKTLEEKDFEKAGKRRAAQDLIDVT